MGILAVDSSVKIFAFSLLFAISYISFAGAHPEEPDQVKDLASCLDYVDLEFEREYETKIYDKREKDFMERCKQKKDKDYCTILWLTVTDQEILDAYNSCRKKYKR